MSKIVIKALNDYNRGTLTRAHLIPIQQNSRCLQRANGLIGPLLIGKHRRSVAVLEEIN